MHKEKHRNPFLQGIQTMWGHFLKAIPMVIVAVVFSTAVVLAATGTTNSPGGPSSSAAQMYTLEDIYQRLSTGSYFTQSTFTEPGSAPGTGTMHTLNDIMAIALPRAMAKRVPKTGQTGCWDIDGNPITCAGTGQDGQYQKGIEPIIVPTTILADAYNMPTWTGVRFIDNGDGTVTDNLTGLIWLKNANCFGQGDWQDALNNANTLADGSCGLSDSSIGGNWRLPNVNELHSLIDITQSNPALPPDHPFINVHSSEYWSSTTGDSPKSVLTAWMVYIWNGNQDTVTKTSNIVYMWPVRGGD